MRQIRSSQRGDDPLSLPAFRNSLKLNPSDSVTTASSVIGGTGALPASVFGKEMKERKSSVATTEFVKMYGYVDLGEKLRASRPEGEGREWFSVGELNERLIRLREMEEKESLSTIKGVSFMDLRERLLRLQVSDEDKAKN